MIGQLDWATPWAALLALAPLLLVGLARRRRRRLAAWAEPHLRPWAVAAAGSARDRHRWLDALAWACLALAAAGPRLPLDAAPEAGTSPRHALTLMVVLDISASMAAADIAPDRRTRARLELADLARRLAGERIGLIVYAGRAGMLLPPTDDMALFMRALDQVEPDLIEAPGSNPPEALALAAGALKDAPARAVLIVTDAEPPGTEAARPLIQAGIPLYVLAVASPAGAPIPLPDGGCIEQDGQQVVSRPDPAAWRALARATGGAYAPVADGDADWATLHDHGIAALPGAPLPPERARAWQTLHAWPLAAALALFLLARWPRMLPLLLLAALLPPPAEAVEVGSSPAWHTAMRAGVAAWTQRDYAAAARGFGTALLLAGNARQRADALYDLGSAHYGLGHWQAAAEAWRAVLALRPGDANAAANLARAQAQLDLHRAAPPRGDLRGRRGGLAQGEIDPEFDTGGMEEAFEPGPAGTQKAAARGAAGARLAAGQARARRIEADARLLPSGLGKLELLEDRPRALLRGQLRQDTPPDASALELAPW